MKYASVALLGIGLLVGCGTPETTSPGTTTFSIVNTGSTMIYVQSSGFSGQGVIGLATSQGALPFSDTCEVCNCGPCPSCAVCGRGLAKVAALAPGASWTYAWDQRVFVVEKDGCRAGLDCENPERVAPQTLTASATWADSFAVDPTFGANDEFLVGHQTKAQTWKHPAATVRIEIP